jgi:hypothetical protein
VAYKLKEYLPKNMVILLTSNILSLDFNKISIARIIGIKRPFSILSSTKINILQKITKKIVVIFSFLLNLKLSETAAIPTKNNDILLKIALIPQRPLK